MNNSWKSRVSKGFTTAIGSLPHADVDSALQFSFRLKIPFLPQIPIRNDREFMVHQALEGLPGIKSGKSGEVSFEFDQWEKGRQRLRELTDQAFQDSQPTAFESFEPMPQSWSCWKPFLWELEERETKVAKIQIAGPLTCQWALKIADSEVRAEVRMQIFRFTLAKSIAMLRRIQESGAFPVLFIDEPGLYGFSISNPNHRIGLEELKIFIQTLKKENAAIGIHCCSNTDWESLLQLPIDILSIDTGLSLSHLLKHRETVSKYLARGGTLSLGVIPTGEGFEEGMELSVAEVVEGLTTQLNTALGETLGAKVLNEALITPACGLALQSVEEAEKILTRTRQVGEAIRTTVGPAA